MLSYPRGTYGQSIVAIQAKSEQEPLPRENSLLQKIRDFVLPHIHTAHPIPTPTHPPPPHLSPPPSPSHHSHKKSKFEVIFNLGDPIFPKSTSSRTIMIGFSQTNNQNCPFIDFPSIKLILQGKKDWNLRVLLKFWIFDFFNFEKFIEIWFRVGRVFILNGTVKTPLSHQLRPLSTILTFTANLSFGTMCDFYF